ncbi:MAG: 2-dehydropantoate 2-reductase [Sulfitobacter sp.]
MKSRTTAAPHIVIAGAGAVGCFVGGMLVRGGRSVSFLGRSRVLDDLRHHGLRLTDYGDLDVTLTPDQLDLHEDSAVLARADIILVCVKSAATASIAQQIAEHAPAGAIIVSLQNGMGHAQTLGATLPAHDIRAGMVPFNVVPMAQGGFHRASSGDIVIGTGDGALPDILSVDALCISQSVRIEAVQWGKFLLNLNNAPNALSGLSLHAQLLDRGWRRLMADQMAEALRVLRAHGCEVAPTTSVPVGLVPHILRLPTPVFRRLASRMLTIDPQARTSMAHDLAAGRVTEIDALQGLIIAMGREKSVPTPLCERMLEAVKAAQGQSPIAHNPDNLRR